MGAVGVLVCLDVAHADGKHRAAFQRHLKPVAAALCQPACPHGNQIVITASPQPAAVCPRILLYGVLFGTGVRNGAVVHVGFECGIVFLKK